MRTSRLEGEMEAKNEVKRGGGNQAVKAKRTDRRRKKKGMKVTTEVFKGNKYPKGDGEWQESWKQF